MSKSRIYGKFSALVSSSEDESSVPASKPTATAAAMPRVATQAAAKRNAAKKKNLYGNFSALVSSSEDESPEQVAKPTAAPTRAVVAPRIAQAASAPPAQNGAAKKTKGSKKAQPSPTVPSSSTAVAAPHAAPASAAQLCPPKAVASATAATKTSSEKDGSAAKPQPSASPHKSDAKTIALSKLLSELESFLLTEDHRDNNLEDDDEVIAARIEERFSPCVRKIEETLEEIKVEEGADSASEEGGIWFDGSKPPYRQLMSRFTYLMERKAKAISANLVPDKLLAPIDDDDDDDYDWDPRSMPYQRRYLEYVEALRTETTCWGICHGDDDFTPQTFVWKRFADVMATNTHLKELYMRGFCHVSAAAGRYIYQALRNNRTLETLRVSCPPHDHMGWLGALLRVTQGIKTLQLEDVVAQCGVFHELHSGLYANTSLTSLSLDFATDDDIIYADRRGVFYLAYALKVNSTLKELKLILPSSSAELESAMPGFIERLTEALDLNLSLVEFKILQHVETGGKWVQRDLVASDPRAAKLLAANKEPPLILQSQLKEVAGKVEMKLLKMSGAEALTLLVDPAETRARLQRKIEDQLELVNQRAVVLLPSGEALHKVIERDGKRLNPWTSTVTLVDLYFSRS